MFVHNFRLGDLTFVFDVLSVEMMESLRAVECSLDNGRTRLAWRSVTGNTQST